MEGKGKLKLGKMEGGSMLRKIVFTAFGTLSLLLILTGNLPAQEVFQPGQQIGWQLTSAQVIRPGNTATGPQGIVTSGYEIEAEATAVGVAPIRHGIFRLNLTVNAPLPEVTGQKAASYHLRGNWSITDKNLPPQAAKARHSQGVIKGDLSGESSFNPTLSPGKIAVQVRVPMSPLTTGWGKGKGTFKGNEKFEGQLDLTLERWQRTSKPEGEKK